MIAAVEFVKVTTVPNRPLAELACQMLHQAGLEAFYKLDGVSVGFGMSSLGIYVPEDESEAAERVLPPAW